MAINFCNQYLKRIGQFEGFIDITSHSQTSTDPFMKASVIKLQIKNKAILVANQFPSKNNLGIASIAAINNDFLSIRFLSTLGFCNQRFRHIACKINAMFKAIANVKFDFLASNGALGDSISCCMIKICDTQHSSLGSKQSIIG